MRVLFSERAWDEYLYWQANDKRKLKRINELIRAIQRTPYQGVGQPEPLRYSLAGFWSRRIDREHRLVYKVEAEAVFIVQCRFHYE